MAERSNAKQGCAEAWIKAFIAYAKDNRGQLPTSFAQAKPFWPRSNQFWPNTVSESASDADQEFEILYQGSLDALTNREVIVFREKKPGVPWAENEGGMTLWPMEPSKASRASQSLA